VNDTFRDLDALPPWWRLGFDGKALLETAVGSVVGLIALFSSYDHVNLPHRKLLRLLSLINNPAPPAMG